MKLENMSRREHNRLFNTNFTHQSLYSTLTFDDEHKVQTIQEAIRIRDEFLVALKRKHPNAVIYIYIGEGKQTHRFHFHTVSNEVPKEAILEEWNYGSVTKIDSLDIFGDCSGVDHREKYTSLANYLIDHYAELPFRMEAEK